MPARLYLRARAQVRLPKGTMNATERKFAAEVLDPLLLAGELAGYWYEPLKLRLADKCFLDIDFMCQYRDGTIELVDVKARWSNNQVGTDDARVKLKVAGAMFPFRVRAAVWDRKAGWTYEEFSPEG